MSQDSKIINNQGLNGKPVGQSEYPVNFMNSAHRYAMIMIGGRGELFHPLRDEKRCFERRWQRACNAPIFQGWHYVEAVKK